MTDTLYFADSAAVAARVICSTPAMVDFVVVDDETGSNRIVVAKPDWPLSSGQAELWALLGDLAGHGPAVSLLRLTQSLDESTWLAVITAMVALRPEYQLLPVGSAA